MTRQNLVPYTFSGPDGPHVPAGNWISVPSRAIMRDPAYYSSPETFDPLRFATNVTAAGKTDTGANAAHTKYTDASYKFPLWGLGKRVWSVPSPSPGKKTLVYIFMSPPALQSIPHSTQNWFNLRETSTGRFYASIALKLVVGEILLNYDLKLVHENGAAKKETFFIFDSFRIPRACISMRRRSYNGDVVGDNAWEVKLESGSFKTIVIVFLGGRVYPPLHSFSNSIDFFPEKYKLRRPLRISRVDKSNMCRNANCVIEGLFKNHKFYHLILYHLFIILATE